MARIKCAAKQVHIVQLWTRMPIQLFHPVDTEALGVVLFLDEHMYTSFLARLSPLCFGALAALSVIDLSCTWRILR